jgi:hypothetical protein
MPGIESVHRNQPRLTYPQEAFVTVDPTSPTAPELVVLCGSFDRVGLEMARLADELRSTGTWVHCPVRQPQIRQDDHIRICTAMVAAATRMVVVTGPDGHLDEATAGEVAAATQRALPIEYVQVSTPELPLPDLAARLAAADLAWARQVGDTPHEPTYIRWLADLAERFEPRPARTDQEYRSQIMAALSHAPGHVGEVVDAILTVPNPEAARLRAIVDRVRYDSDMDMWDMTVTDQQHMTDLARKIEVLAWCHAEAVWHHATAWELCKRVTRLWRAARCRKCHEESTALAALRSAVHALLDHEVATAPDGLRLAWTAWPAEYGALAAVSGWSGGASAGTTSQAHEQGAEVSVASRGEVSGCGE